jgi:hypothetical protein
LNFNNKEVTAVKFTGRDKYLKECDHAPVRKILNSTGEVMWESVWLTQQVLRVKTGSQLSSAYPECYYSSGKITLEKYLALVVMGSPTYATNSWKYIPSTGELSYTIYLDEALSESATMINCYKYLERFEYNPIITCNITNKNANTGQVTFTCALENRNSNAQYTSVNVLDEFDNKIYSTAAAVPKNGSKVLTITVVARTVRVVATFITMGYVDAVASRQFYPFE